MLRIRLFGQLRLSDGDHPLKFSGPPRTLPLLAFLLLRRGQAVSRDRLAALLWPDDPEREARGNLRRHLYHLQRALPPAPPERPWLLAEGGELQWNPAGDWWLDVAEFEQQIDEAGLQAEAVALYTEDLLPDLYDDWIIVERERLRDLLFHRLLQLIRHRRAAGDLAQAAAFARLLLGRDPLHEEALRELLSVLALSGERALALQEYRRFEHRLREELGVEPMPETVAVYQSVGRNGPLAGEAPPAHAPAARPAAPAAAPAAHLPIQLTAFVGRREELAEVCRLIRPPDGPARLLTLTGPGGSGKTRLALEAAARLAKLEPDLFPSGVYFVRLSDIGDPALVASAIAAQLGFQESGQSPAAQLKQALRDTNALLVLDNFEQVVEAAPLVADLLLAAPGLRVVVTSRAVLRLYGEVEFPVPPLPLPDLAHLPPAADLMNYAAVALFVERARAANRQFALTASNAAQVAEICVRLDGLPLALELAAARSKMFGPAAMLSRLSSRLEFLTGQARSVAARQQTLRLAIDWSYNLLAPAEQALFARLGVFVGGFTLEAAGAIGNDEASSLEDLVASLADQSMLRPDWSVAPGGGPRYTLLLTLREYALFQLGARGELDDFQERHARYFLALAERAGPELLGANQAERVKSLEADYDNIRAALAWALEKEDDSEGVMRAFVALGHFWYLRSHLEEGRCRLTQALAHCVGAPAPLRAEAARAAGMLALTQADYPAARALIDQALAILDALGPENGVLRARALRNRGLLAWHEGEIDLSRSLLRQSLSAAREAEDAHSIAHALNGLGLLDNEQGDEAPARAYFEEGLTFGRQAGDLLCIANILNNLGLLAHAQGELVGAQGHLDEALKIFRQLGHRQGVAIALNNLGNIHRDRGDLATAAACYEESIAVDRDHGNEAHTAYPLFGLAALATLRGDAAVARSAFARSLEIRHRLGDRRGQAQALEGIAWVLSRQGRPEEAARLLGAAAALREMLVPPLRGPEDSVVRQAANAAAQQALPPQAYEAGLQAGRALSLDEAVALAARAA